MGKWNRIYAGVGCLLIAIVLLFLYYWLLMTSSGGAFASLLLMFLFGMTFLTFYTAMGMFGVQVLEELTPSA